MFLTEFWSVKYLSTADLRGFVFVLSFFTPKNPDETVLLTEFGFGWLDWGGGKKKEVFEDETVFDTKFVFG